MSMGNHITPSQFVRYSASILGFSTLIRGFFCVLGLKVRTDQRSDPKTLLTFLCAAPALPMILPSAVGAKEERPFLLPFLTSAHRQSRSCFCFGCDLDVNAAAFSLAACSLA